jgi:hypothetical protein
LLAVFITRVMSLFTEERVLYGIATFTVSVCLATVINNVLLTEAASGRIPYIILSEQYGLTVLQKVYVSKLVIPYTSTLRVTCMKQN